MNTAGLIPQESSATAGDAIPADVIEAIANATGSTTIYPVNPGEVFDGQILKADEIVFAPGATLTLTNGDAPFIVIAAKRWKFADATINTRIEVDRTIPAKAGANGNPGSNGADGQGEVNRRGNDGAAGGPGQSGADGESKPIPHIYLIAGELTSPEGEPLPGYLRLSLLAVGKDGGDGGAGGKGGNGGPGARGKEGATSLFDCKEGPGQGGTGGAAGQGGQGGRGGNASDGAHITIIGTGAVNELFSYARIINEGGYGGRAGRTGIPGKVGAGGRAAPGNGFCGAGRPGDAGDYPSPPDLGSRGAGDDGGKGATTLISVKSLTPVF
jgi:hypothetical protein